MKMVQRRRQTQFLHRLYCHPQNLWIQWFLDMCSCTTADCPLFTNLENFVEPGEFGGIWQGGGAVLEGMSHRTNLRRTPLTLLARLGPIVREKTFSHLNGSQRGDGMVHQLLCVCLTALSNILMIKQHIPVNTLYDIFIIFWITFYLLR